MVLSWANGITAQVGIKLLIISRKHFQVKGHQCCTLSICPPSCYMLLVVILLICLGNLTMIMSKVSIVMNIFKYYNKLWVQDHSHAFLCIHYAQSLSYFNTI